MIMRHLKLKHLAAIASLCAVVASGLFAAMGCAAPKASPSAVTTPAQLSPNASNARIAYETARFLETLQYSQLPLDTAMSEKFYDGYLQTLDPLHENFLQSDLEDFAHYRTNLDKLTVGGRGRADLTPAYEIFDRFLDRLAEHTDYVDKLLKQDHFKFDTDEQIDLDRRHAPYPKDLAEAQTSWRRQLRFEYLQEKLGREFSPTNGGTILPLPKNADEEIAAGLAKRYDWTLRTLTNWDSDSVLQIYLNALAHAYDPHTDYLNEQHSADFKISMSLQLAGIGAQLREDYGYCTIDSLIPNGPADQSKQINPKDRIIAVAQSNGAPVNVVNMELPNVVEMIRGPKGTQVRLTVEAKDDPSSRHVVTLTRDIIKLQDQQAKAQIIEMPDDNGGTNRIGVINVPSFYAPIGNPDATNFISLDVARLLKKLEQEKVAGVLLDMRGNPGGSLEEAIRFTGLFIQQGPVVFAKDFDGKIGGSATADPQVLYSGPLAVLINRYSASAAEIAAAALQDYGRALIVGDTSTHGKGTVQSLNPLDKFILTTNDPGELKITIRKFYRITGASTQLRGVEPDIVLPDTLNYDTGIGESSLDNALPYDTLPAQSLARVSYHKFNLVQPYLGDLRLRSDARIATNQDFAFVRQDIEDFRKQQNEKSETLNEQQALNERKQNAAEKQSRDKAILKENPASGKVYELTLENVDKPGLPDPTVETNSPSNISPARLDDDVRLKETERILQDYIFLLPKTGGMIANQ